MPQRDQELERLREALAAAGDVIYDWDVRADTIVWVGPAGDLFGRVGAEPSSSDALHKFIYVEDLPRRFKALSHHFTTREPFECEYRIRGGQGRLIWVQDRGQVRFGADGRPARMFGTMRVVTARKQREAQLEFLANFDELTGHFNRTRLKEALEHAIAFGARYRSAGAYLSVGIDKLSTINEAFGYETADAVIVGVSQRLDRCLRAADVVGRLGGDRFGVVLGHCPEHDLAAAAEKILQSIRNTPIDTPSGSIHVTVSVGAARFDDVTTTTAHEAMSRAESALKEAKGAGRNCFVVFHDSEEQRQTRRQSLAITEEVQTALKSDRVIFAFQPVVDARDYSIDHYECLLRLRREDGSLVVAGAFLPVVEQSGLMRQLDRRALDLAIEELTRHGEVRLALNISGLTAADRSWLRSLNAALKGRPDVARRLTIEITETVALEDIEETARFVAAVRDLGCRVALDDFGAGYTSFRNLKALAVDCVKIDGSFVRGLADNVDNQLFIRTLLSLAEGFGLSTVAECVETAAEATHLARRGVRYLQGYYFGAPSIDRPWLNAGATARTQAPDRSA